MPANNLSVVFRRSPVIEKPCGAGSAVISGAVDSEFRAENMSDANVKTRETAETHPFQAEVAELLRLMVHAVYSETDVFLRELISNASDACDKLRYEAIAKPDLLGDGARSRSASRPTPRPGR